MGFPFEKYAPITPTGIDNSFAETQRDLSGDLGSRAFRGLLDLGDLASGIGTTFTGDTSPGFLDNLVTAGRETDFAKPDINEFLGRESTIKRFVGQAVQAAPVSLAGAAAAVGATALGQPELAMPAALLVSATLFGPGTYGQTFKENVDALGEEKARALALKTSLAELGSELPSTLLTVGAGGALFKTSVDTLKKQGLDITIKNMMKAVSGKQAVKQFLKTGAEIGVTEIGTEAAGSAYQADALNKAHGRVIIDPVDAAIDAAGTAAVMSLMFVGASSGMSTINKSKLKLALQSEDKVLQKAASSVIADNLTDPEIQKAWNAQAQEVLNTPGAVFSLDDKFMELGDAIEVEASKPVSIKDNLSTDKSTEALVKEKVDTELAKATRPTPVPPLARTAQNMKEASRRQDLEQRAADAKEQFGTPVPTVAQEVVDTPTADVAPVPTDATSTVSQFKTKKERDVAARQQALAAYDAYEPTDSGLSIEEIRKDKFDKVKKLTNLLSLDNNRTVNKPVTEEEYAKIFSTASTQVEVTAERRADAREAFSDQGTIENLQAKVAAGETLTEQDIIKLAKARGFSKPTKATDTITVNSNQIVEAVKDAKLNEVISQDSAPQTTVITVTPEEFLKLTTAQDSTLDNLRKTAEPKTDSTGKEVTPLGFSKEELANSPAPYIVVDEEGNIVGHEGRMRAVLAERSGITKYEVAVIHEGDLVSDIKSQRFGSRQRDFSIKSGTNLSPIEATAANSEATVGTATIDKEIATDNVVNARGDQSEESTRRTSGKSKKVPGSKFVFVQGEENTDRSGEIIGKHPQLSEVIHLEKILNEKKKPIWSVFIAKDSNSDPEFQKGLKTYKLLADAKKAAVDFIESSPDSKVSRGVLRNQVGGGTIPLDVAKGIIKVGMKIGTFAKLMRKALGKGYSKVRGQIRKLFVAAKAHLAKITTGTQVGALGDTAISTDKVSKQVTKEQIVSEDTNTPIDTKSAVEAKLNVDKEEKKKVERTPEEYAKYVKEELTKNLRSDSTKEIVKDKYARFVKDSTRIFKNSFQTIDAGVHRISRRLQGNMRTGETLGNTLHKKYSNAALPFVKEVGKLSSLDHDTLFFGLRNGINDKFGAYASALEILDAPGNENLRKTYDSFRKDVIEDAEKRLVATGRLTEIIPEWFPSKAKDPLALFNALDSDIKSKFHKQIAEESAKRKRKNLPFTEGDKIDFIAMLLSSNRFNAVRSPGNLRERTIDHVSPKYVALYEDIPTTIAAYIGEITEDLAISKMVGRSNRLQTINALNKLRIKVEKGEATKEQFDKLAGTLETIETDRDNSLASLISKEKNLTPEQIEEVSLLFKARFNQRGTRGAVQTFKNLSLLTTIGNVFSAITQLGDPMFNIYKHGKFAPESMWGALVDPDKISKFFDFNSVLREFTADKIGTAPGLDFALKWSGLRTLDLFGKESFLQGAQAKWSSESIERFTKKFSDLFPKGTSMKELQNKLKNEEYSDFEVQTLLMSTLGEVQPISISDAPVYFASGGNLRILYMLKLFAIKSVNLAVTEATDEWSKGTNQSKTKGIMKATYLIALLTMAGMGTDEIKDLILSRNTSTSFSDKAFSNLLQLGMLNQYSIDKGIKSGNLIESILSNNLPATRFPSRVITDVFKTINGEPSYKSLAGLPLGGKIAYEGFFGIGGTRLAEEADVKRIRRQITKDIDDSIENGISQRLKDNVREFNSKANKLGLTKVVISKLRTQAKRRLRDRNK